ncbi:unnamed protein product [Peniophora sp. CBMAI 1063]|nr:unnamed protein product [Peniophora sp. CBMAI 1063]
MSAALAAIPPYQSDSIPAVVAVEELPSYEDARAEATASRRRRSAPIPFATYIDAHHRRTTTSDVRRPDPYISERSFHIRTTKGVAWLTMTLRSRATSAKYLPLYCDRDVIRGNVTLELQETMRLKAIVLKYRCVISGQIQQVVLDKEQNIWPQDSAQTGFLPRGKHVMPIEFPIPHEVPNPRRPGQMIDLPPTFTEGGGSAVYIDYMFSVSLRKPRLNMSRKITTEVGYYPRTVCGAPSLLRSLAYENNTSLLGPELDPSGWRILPSVNTPRTVFETRVILIEYTLAIAEPLSFAIGGSIPVFLTIKSPESQALDIAASRADVRLRRVVGVGRRNTSCKHIARAVFRPYERIGRANEDTRCLQGEISIPKGTTPSFTWLDVTLRYDIALYSPTIAEPTVASTPAFLSSGNPLHSEKVVVTAASPRHGSGDLLSSLPPAYGL